MLISYSSKDEVIICTLEKEEEVLREYFELGGRNIDDYDREEAIEDIVEIEASLKSFSY